MKTSLYKNRALADKRYAVIRISLGHPRWRTPYKMAGVLPELAPTRDMLGMTQAAYRKRYLKLLDALDIDAVRVRIAEIAGDREPVLCCFEDLSEPDKWCHRRMFADWWTAMTGEPIEEL